MSGCIWLQERLRNTGAGNGDMSRGVRLYVSLDTRLGLDCNAWSLQDLRRRNSVPVIYLRSVRGSRSGFLTGPLAR